MREVENPVRRGAVKPWSVLPALLLAAAAAWVFHGATRYGFSQDDFAALARANGILPRFTEPWRWLSLQGYFDLMRPVAGLDPLPYHLTSLAAHALVSVLVFRLLRRFAGRAAAFAGAAFFAAHVASFTAVYWISTTGDLLALTFALIALEWSARGRALSLLAAPAFALSLLCKESLLLLPAVVAAWRVLDRRHRPARERRAVIDPGLALMILVAAAYMAYFVFQNGLHLTPEHGAGPYAIRAGSHLLGNAATYLGWTANPWLPTVRGFTDAVDPPVFAWGGALAAVWLIGAFAPSLRARGWWHAGILYAAFIAPVLPLERHTYHYYLYGALAGASLGVAALIDLTVEWLKGGGKTPEPAGRARAAPPAGPAATIRLLTGPLIATLAAAVFFINGHLMVQKVETQPFGHPDLRAEPIVDRARIAANVRAALSAADLPQGVTLHFYSPEARSMAPASNPAGETYWERNVRSALYDGVAVRLFAPAVAEVRFIRAPDTLGVAWQAIYDVTGRTRIVPPAPIRPR